LDLSGLSPSQQEMEEHQTATGKKIKGEIDLLLWEGKGREAEFQFRSMSEEKIGREKKIR